VEIGARSTMVLMPEAVRMATGGRRLETRDATRTFLDLLEASSR